MRAATDLRAELVSATGTDRVHQNSAPQEFVGPYVWFGFSGAENEDTLDGPRGEAPFLESYDIECVANRPEDAEQLAIAIRALHLHRGQFGLGSVQGCFLSDQPADYVSRQDSSDDGLHVTTLKIEIAGYTGG